MDMSYLLLKVENLETVESLRIVRNSCREYMTNYNQEIGHEQQKEWFAKLDRNKNFPFLFFEKDNHMPIGYGFITTNSNTCYLTAGLVEEYRGKSLGQILFNLLIGECKKMNFENIELEVFKTNERAYKLYKKLGFKVISDNANKYFMEL